MSKHFHQQQGQDHIAPSGESHSHSRDKIRLLQSFRTTQYTGWSKHFRRQDTRLRKEDQWPTVRGSNQERPGRLLGWRVRGRRNGGGKGIQLGSRQHSSAPWISTHRHSQHNRLTNHPILMGLSSQQLDSRQETQTANWWMREYYCKQESFRLRRTKHQKITRKMFTRLLCSGIPTPRYPVAASMLYCGN